MKTNVGRVVGALVFVQLAGLIVPFVLLDPAVKTDYLGVDAAMAGTIKTAVFMLFANAAVTLGIAIAAFPELRRYSVRAAILLIVVSTVWVVMQSVDNAHLLSMLSLSTRYSDAGGANADVYNVLGSQVRSTRIWVHYTELLVIDVWMAVFYALCFAYRLVPRTIGAIGLVAVAVHLFAIPMAMFIGYPNGGFLGASLAVSHVLVGGWLIAKGFPVVGVDAD
jgi:hypothetical protein